MQLEATLETMAANMKFIHQLTGASLAACKQGRDLLDAIRQIRDINAIDPAKRVAAACISGAISKMGAEKPSEDTLSVAAHGCPHCVSFECVQLASAINAYTKLAADVPTDENAFKLQLDDTLLQFLGLLLQDVGTIDEPEPKRTRRV